MSCAIISIASLVLEIFFGLDYTHRQHILRDEEPAGNLHHITSSLDTLSLQVS